MHIKKSVPSTFPPLTTCFVHQSLLHHFALIFAPCLTQTPPFRACLAHLSLLHRLTFARCFTCTPPLTLRFCILNCCIHLICPMLFAHSSLLCSIQAAQECQFMCAIVDVVLIDASCCVRMHFPTEMCPLSCATNKLAYATMQPSSSSQTHSSTKPMIINHFISVFLL
jgi:hypothetical protein